MHVSRAKNGSPSVHPLSGVELRALRRLKRDQEPPSPFVFTSERGAPFTTAGWRRHNPTSNPTRRGSTNRIYPKRPVRGGDVMKVKTFTGSETAKVDKRVNDWLAQFGIRPHHTNTAIGQFTVKAEDQRTGKPVNRRVAVIAISVWYEEPAASTSPTAKCM